MVCVYIYVYIYIYIERERERERELMPKLFVHLSILNILIHFSESNASMMSGFYVFISKKKKFIYNSQFWEP